jgi:hypothetical protein
VSDFETILFMTFGLVGIAGYLWFLGVAFGQSASWGIGCLLVPFVGLLFLIQHSDKAWKPFLVYVGGLGPLVVYAALTTPPPTPAATAPVHAAPVVVEEQRPAKKNRRASTTRRITYQ